MGAKVDKRKSKTTRFLLFLSLASVLLFLGSFCGYLSALYEPSPSATAYFKVEGSPHKTLKQEIIKTAKAQGFRVGTKDVSISFEGDFWADFIRSDIAGHASTAGDKKHLIVSLNKSKYFSVPTDDEVKAVTEIYVRALEGIEGVIHDRTEYQRQNNKG